jgi:putative NADH-flavin reductase
MKKVVSIKIFIAGSTGYLGRFLVDTCMEQGHHVRALTRRDPGPGTWRSPPQEVFFAQATDPSALQGCCDDIDLVISSLGITRQKDGMSIEILRHCIHDYPADRLFLGYERCSGHGPERNGLALWKRGI